ncbi:pyridoxal phosphate-dependent transferase [Cristinia sonorae]|uniref:Pyridoxal phosphate-dependent transferase n=1 Tax=Cristinia sonorae TaxID=1940300 RepID=A0A8K0XP82_9AGAR|nr:pyridoxal phosphate-dependent transferase [Cristinia sonorae]
MSGVVTDDDYKAVGAWFLGPKGENAENLADLLLHALIHTINGRIDYFPEDPPVITADMMASESYQHNIEKLNILVDTLGPELAKNSVPFWNPRYNGHMLMDTSLPGMVGYFTAMLSNQNNVAIEASPLTTIIEIRVGKQLAELAGYNINISSNEPVGWGHITCDGSVANLESMWAARNLKFYPLSLRLAMQKELSFIADTFVVPTCKQSAGDGSSPKLLKDFTEWELLNIMPSDVLNIPTRLTDEYGISSDFLQSALSPYLAQTLGKEELEKEFHVKPMAYFASATMHYSWPKGAAITGIGSKNVIPVAVDNSARMDPQDLRSKLRACLDAKDAQGNAAPRAVYAVVAIIGSTEHGACDPLKDIVDIREEFRKEGLSFVIHADGAWGTYFTSTIPDTEMYIDHSATSLEEASNKSDESDFVPTVTLKPKTKESLLHLRHCDSVTVDPHKSGFIQYPAGGLLYRDQRMRYLVTWTSPIVYRNDPESIGVYGVEGSKPGAAPVATWFSHTIIRRSGYGQILGEALFSCVRMYAHLATMSDTTTPFIVRPLNLLPAEESGGDVEAQKTFIRRNILNVPNMTLRHDSQAWGLLVEMGSDLSINAFAVNFKIGDHVNQDVVEANYLNKRIFEALSITHVDDDKPKPKLFLTSTTLSQENYGKCLTTFKERLGLVGDQDLYTLVNVIMSPWPTAHGMTTTVAQALQETIERETEISLYRNTVTPDFHAFVMQGIGKVFLVHLAMFNMENHRSQLIMTGSLDPLLLRAYIRAKSSNPNATFLLVNRERATLDELTNAPFFNVQVEQFNPNGRGPVVAKGRLGRITVLAQSPLNSANLTPYPKLTMPFRLYGAVDQYHIDHVYTASPNIQLSADQVNIQVESTAPAAANAKPVDLFSTSSTIFIQLQLAEASMHPFPRNADLPSPFFFRPGAVFRNVSITADVEGKNVITAATVTLGKSVFVDSDMLNEDPMPPVVKSTASVIRNLKMKTRTGALPEVQEVETQKGRPFQKYNQILDKIESKVESNGLL